MGFMTWEKAIIVVYSAHGKQEYYRTARHN